MNEKRHVPARRGSILIYSVIAMTAMLALTSLAVDYGSVQVVKTQLMAAVDASARAGAHSLAIGNTAAQAQAAAIAAAGSNTANSTAVALTMSDVLVGNWDSTAGTFAANTTPYNAVQVNAALTAAKGTAVKLWFARIVGRNTCDVHASAAATYKPSGYGIVGLNFITMGGNTSDSYWNTTGATGGQRGSIASNGNITLSGSSYINGDAHPGVGMNVNAPSKVSGSTTRLTSPLVYPNGDAGSSATTNDNTQITTTFRTGPNQQDLVLKANDVCTAPGGTYYFHDVNLSGGSTLSFTGPATLYVWHNLTMGGNTSTASNLPGNLHIICCPSTGGAAPGPISLSGTSALYADIYAPQSPITMSGTGDLYGSLVGLSINMTGTSTIHYDILNDPNAGKVTLVQ